MNALFYCIYLHNKIKCNIIYFNLKVLSFVSLLLNLFALNLTTTKIVLTPQYSPT